MTEATSVTVQAISNGENKPYKNPGDVDVKINYPKDYKGPKYHTDGEIVTTSKEGAEEYVKRGIGSVVEPAAQEEEKKEAETVQETPAVNEPEPIAPEPTQPVVTEPAAQEEEKKVRVKTNNNHGSLRTTY